MTLTLPKAVFAPVRSQTAFEETVERLGTAIKLGLLAPGRGCRPSVSCAHAWAPPQTLARWRDTCDRRLAVELGVAVLAAERASSAELEEIAPSREDRA